MKSGDFLQGKCVFITGAARGIGAAAARRLYQCGASVVLVGLELDAMQAIASELGSRAACFKADVSDPSQVQNAVDAAVRLFGAIDVVIANAGIYTVTTFAEAPPGAVERTLQVNLFGVWHTIQATLPHIIKSKGYILTVSSMAALTNGGFMGAYAASKAGVEAMTNSLRVEMKYRGVDVGCAYFAAIDTDMVRGGLKHPVMEILSPMYPKFMDPVPLSRAIDAIEKGIRKRSGRIWVPGWLAIVIALRGIIQPIMERSAVRDKRYTEALELSVRESGNLFGQDPELGVAANLQEEK